MDIKQYIKIARPANLLLVGTVVLIAATLFKPFPNFWTFILVVLCPVLITAAGNTINDMCDIEIDRINKPDRPLPSGALNLGRAKVFMISVFILGNTAALLLGFWSLIISLFATALLFWYAYRLRHVALIGNVVVSFLSAMTFLFAAQAFGDMKRGYVPFLLTFVLSLVREIVKDLEDLEGDEAHGSKTLPVIIGGTPTRVIAGLIAAFFIPLIPVPYVAEMYGKWYFFMAIPGVAIPMLIMMVNLFQIKRKINYHQMAIILKVVMFIGLASVFMGRF